MNNKFTKIAITPYKVFNHKDFIDYVDKVIRKKPDFILLRTPKSNPFLKFYLNLLLNRNIKTIIHAGLMSEIQSFENIVGIHFTRRTLNKYIKIPTNLLLGYSAHSPEEVLKYQSLFDYFFLGHIFKTPSHPFNKPQGIKKLKEAAKISRKPVIAIGGITAKLKINACKKNGASGFASIRYY